LTCADDSAVGSKASELIILNVKISRDNSVRCSSAVQPLPSGKMCQKSAFKWSQNANFKAQSLPKIRRLDLEAVLIGLET